MEAKVLHKFYINQAVSGESDRLLNSLCSEGYGQGTVSSSEMEHPPQTRRSERRQAARLSSPWFIGVTRLNGSEEKQMKNPRMG